MIDTGRAKVVRMDRAECFALLEAEDVGRLAVVQGSAPAIFPVNYVLDGEDIVIRTAPGSKVAHGAGTTAAFEIDHLDRERREGWSIVALGHLDVVDDDAAVLTRVQALPIAPWAAGPKDIVLRLTVGTVTGRLLIAPREDPQP